MSRPGFEADRFRIVLRELGDRERRRRSTCGPTTRRAGTARPASSRWSADGRELCSPPTTSASTPSSPSTSRPARPRLVVTEGQDASPQPAGAGPHPLRAQLAARADRALHASARDGSDERARHAPQRREGGRGPLRRARAVHASRARTGETVYGYVVKPVDFDPAKKYPVAFLIHGGPAGLLRQRLPLPLEPAGLRRRRLRRGDGRLPRLDRLRPGLHRRDPRRLGRQALRGPREGPRRRARAVPVPRRRRGCAPSAPPTAAT